MEENNLNNSSPFSVRFINPEAVVDELELDEGITVADFGCGSGYFSLPIAKKIGEGTVYSFDILPQSLESVESRAKTQGITNIVGQRANLEKPEGSKLPEQSVDWVIMKDMLFQNKDKAAILKEAQRVLKGKGKALVIEWNMDDASIGPEKSLRISKEALINIAGQCGLGVFKELEVGDFHYGLILIK